MEPAICDSRISAWNRTDAPYDVTVPVHRSVEAQARRALHAVALEQVGETMTYAELNGVANAIGWRLHELGVVAAETPVVVLAERSIQAVVAFLSILKAGGSYVPIDAAAPNERVVSMVRDCGARIVMGQSADLARLAPLGDVATLDMDATLRQVKLRADPPPSAHRGPCHRAYVIYTSGSTGAPKGVEVEHHAVANLIAFYRERLRLGPRDRVALTASIGFDASVAQLWPALASGAAVHVPPEDLLIDAPALVAWLSRNDITVADVPTRLAEVLFDEPWPSGIALRTMLTGGDTLRRRPPPGLPFDVINCYGPTENTVDSTWGLVAPADDPYRDPPTIGRPIGNVRAYIVDADLRPVPPGVEGELVLCGEQVARGYLNHARLTAERFPPDPFGAGGTGRMYRSGDRACFRDDGDIVFLGRIDDQVQLRGFRIEPAEIEQAILRHPEVRDAAVRPVVTDSAVDELAAYVVGIDQERIHTTLRAFLAERLPEFMIPATFTACASLPRTLSGKVDRQALPKPVRSRGADGPAFVLPTDDLERRLARIWQELFDLPAVGIDDNFFDLGGHSLLILRLISRMQREGNLRLSPATVLRAPTIRKLAAACRGQGDSALPACVVGLTESGARRPVFCVAGAGGGAHWFHPLLPHLEADRPFYVLEFLGLDPVLSARGGVTEIAAAFREAVKTVQPEGPYLLGGFSSGGLFAWELAHQLRTRGDDVRLLFLLDAYGPGIRLPFWPKLKQYARNFIALSWPDKVIFFTEKRRWIAKSIRLRLAASETRDQALHHRSLVQAHIAAANRYAPPVLEGVVDIFRSERPPRSAPPDPYAGWRGYATGGVFVHEVPGNHFSMFQPPNDRIFAEALKLCIARAERNPEG